jgi:hypothetical protein
MRPTHKILYRNITKDVVLDLKSYNGGVIVMEKDSPFMNIWIEAIENGAIHSFYGEDLLLSLFLFLHQVKGMDLPLKYNWKKTDWGHNPESVIDHWEGEKGKVAIRLLEMNS